MPTHASSGLRRSTWSRHLTLISGHSGSTLGSYNICELALPTGSTRSSGVSIPCLPLRARLFYFCGKIFLREGRGKRGEAEMGEAHCHSLLW